MVTRAGDTIRTRCTARSHRRGAAPRLAVAALISALLVGCGASGDPVTPATTDASTATAGASVTTAPTSSGASSPGASSSDASSSAAAVDPDAQEFPDVLAVAATATDGAWTVAATISSPYDTPERYADAFRVLAPDGRCWACEN